MMSNDNSIFNIIALIFAIQGLGAILVDIIMLNLANGESISDTGFSIIR